MLRSHPIPSFHERLAYTYTYIHTNTYKYTHIQIYTDTSIYISIHLHIYPCLPLFYKRLASGHHLLSTAKCAHIYTYTHIHTYTYKYTHIHTNTYTHIHTHSLTCILVFHKRLASGPHLLSTAQRAHIHTDTNTHTRKLINITYIYTH